MTPVVLDTNVLIDYLKGKSENFQALLIGERGKRLKLFVPTTVLVELFVGYEFLDKKHLKNAGNLLRNFIRVPLTEEIAMQAARIGREQKLGYVGTADLVVAATAVTLDAQVATHNIKHFREIPKLKLFSFDNEV